MRSAVAQEFTHCFVHGLCTVLLMCGLFSAYSQPQWINYANQKWITALAIDSNNLWVGSRCGLVEEINGSRRYHYNRANSDIPSNFINAVAVDKSRNKWIGTNGGGLARLSGTTWTVYETSNSVLPSDVITCISVNPDGEVWVGTNHGVVRIVGNAWSVYDTLNTPQLVSNRVTAIAAGSALAYVGTAKGLTRYRFDTETWFHYNASPYNITSLAMADELVVWVGASYGLWLYDNDSFIDYTASLASNAHYVKALAYNANYGLWVGTLFGGLYNFYGNNWNLHTTANTSLPSNEIEALAVVNNLLWVGTAEDAASFNGTTWSISRFSQYAIPSYYILSMAIDSADHKWFGTDYHGIGRYDGAAWNVYSLTNPQNPGDWVEELFIDRAGGIWAATEMYGVGKYNGTSWTPVYTTANSSLPSNRVISVTQDSAGTFWFATDAGIAKLKGFTWTTLTKTNVPTLPSNIVYAVHCDSTNCVWVGTGSGLVCSKGATWTAFSEPILKTWVNCITSLGSIVYVGTDKGVAVLKSSTTPPSLIASYDTSNSALPSNYVTSVFSDHLHGTYFGTSGGMAKVGRPWRVWTPENSHINRASIYDIAFDRLGNQWLATSSGLEVYNQNGVVGIAGPPAGHDKNNDVSAARFSITRQGQRFVILAPKPVERVYCSDMLGRNIPATRLDERSFSVPGHARGMVIARARMQDNWKTVRLFLR